MPNHSSQRVEVTPEAFPAFRVDPQALEDAPPSTPNGQAAPTMRGAVLIRSHDGRVTSGVWDCAAGQFDVTFECDEVVHILEGEVTVRSNGSVRTLRPGDVALFRTGLTTTWDVPQYVRKLWFHHIPRPSVLQRIKYKLWLLKRSIAGAAES